MVDVFSRTFHSWHQRAQCRTRVRRLLVPHCTVLLKVRGRGETVTNATRAEITIRMDPWKMQLNRRIRFWRFAAVA